MSIDDMTYLNSIIKKLSTQRDISDSELLTLLDTGLTDIIDTCADISELSPVTVSLANAADSIRQSIFKKDVYIRGLIEFSNYCCNDCYYCGIRRSNLSAERYRLSPEDILTCCQEGYALGFRTFVLQSGEDAFYTDSIICDIVSQIKQSFPDCAITLSLGEKSYSSYKAYFNAGADRYLLRHEAAANKLYERLHPKSQTLASRKECLYNLKEIGYQVGAGFMVGAPFQTYEDLIKDLRFLQELKPHMIGIGPFIVHPKTPFSNMKNGNLELTLRLISILRLMHPHVNLPATTALGTLSPYGRELGIRAGANVVMPNLSPVSVREKYELYENKICTGEEAAECKNCLEKRIALAGYNVVVCKGDPL